MAEVIDFSPEHRRCPFCAEQIRVEARICRFCGSMLAEGPIPKRVIPVREDQVSESCRVPAALFRSDPFATISPGDRRIATLLFFNLELCETGAFEEGGEEAPLAELLAACFSIIENLGGTVVGESGGLVRSVFGLPVTHERDPAFALAAADELMAHVRSFRVRRGVDVHLHGGVHTGLVIGGLPGPEVERPLVGPAVQMASRLAATARRDEVVVSVETHGRTADRFDFEPLGVLPSEELETPQRIHRLVGIHPSSFNAIPPLRSSGLPFAGRSNLIAALRDFIRDPPPDEHCGAIAIHAPMGLGKTHAVHEAVVQFGDGVRFHRGAGAPWAKAVSLLPIVDLLRGIFQLASTSRGDEIRESVDVFIDALPPEERPDKVCLRHLLGDPEAVEILRAESPDARSHRLTRALIDLVRGLSQGHRLVLFFDNLQWIDAATERFLKDLLAAPGLDNCRVILATRPTEQEPDLGREMQRLAVEPLARDEARLLLKGIFDQAGVRSDHQRLILERGEGNPLQLEALADSVQFDLITRPSSHRGALERCLGGETPDALHHLIQARISRLDAELQTVLQLGAVLGIRFQFEALALFDLVREGLLEKLLTLESLALLERRVDDRFLTYRFRNLLTREAIFEAIPEQRLRQLHEMAAAALERLLLNHHRESASQIAHHWERAGNCARAAELLVEAGQRALDVGDLPLAGLHLETAIQHLRDLPPTAENPRTLFEALVLLGEVERLAGNLNDSQRHLRLGLQIAHHLGDEELIARALLDLAHTLQERGLYPRARRLLNHALGLGWTQGDTRVQALCHRQQGIIAWQQGYLDEAVDHNRRVLALAPVDQCPSVASDAENNLGLIMWTQGELAQGREHLEIAADLRRRCHMLFGEVITRCNLGIVAEQMGRFREADRHYRWSLHRAEGLGFRRAETALHANLASLDLLRRRWQSALEHSARSVTLARECGDLRSEAIALENSALCEIELGHLAGAAEALKGGGAIAEQIGDRERRMSLALAETGLALAQGDLDSAKDSSEGVRALLEADGPRHLLPSLFHREAEIALAQGDQERAKSLLVEALALAQTSQHRADAIRILRSLCGPSQNLLDPGELTSHCEQLREFEDDLRAVDESE